MSRKLFGLAIRVAISSTILFLPGALNAGARDDSPDGKVRELARRVAAESPRGKAGCVNWNNREAVSEARSEQMKSTFVEELQGNQADASAQAAASGSCGVSVYLERTPTQVVVTARTESGEKQSWIAVIPRAGMPVDNVGASTPRIEKELLWQQSERILDAILVRGENGAADRLIVLSRDAVTVRQKQAGAWKTVYAKRLGDAATLQRMPHGELWFSPDQAEKLKIVVGGKSCQTALTEDSGMTCGQTSDAPRAGMLLASNCDARVWWLRGDGGDMTEADRLELTTTPAQQNQAAVAELTMPGPVLAISSGEALRADSAVVFNLGTGNYEVYRISLACGL